MQISRIPIKAYIPAGNQQQSEPGKVAGVRRINPERNAEQQHRPDPSTPQAKHANALTENEIASAVQEIKAGQPVPTELNRFATAIDTQMQKAIEAYTEELYQPVQEQLSILAGIDFYV